MDGGEKRGREYMWLCGCVFTKHAKFGVKHLGGYINYNKE